MYRSTFSFLSFFLLFIFVCYEFRPICFSLCDDQFAFIGIKGRKKKEKEKFAFYFLRPNVVKKNTQNVAYWAEKLYCYRP